MSAIKAVLRAQYAAAIKGSAYAQKHILERYERAEGEEFRRIAKMNAHRENYVDRAREAIAKAERNGEEPPILLPHPDDVVIDADHGVRFVGPVTDEELAKLEEVCRFRDMFLLQDALDQRHASALGSETPTDQPQTALLFASVINQAVPARFRLSDVTMTQRMMRYGSIPKRQLLKDVHQGWQAFGARPRRGFAFPTSSTMIRRLAHVEEMLEAIEAHEPADMVRHLRELFEEADDLTRGA